MLRGLSQPIYSFVSYFLPSLALQEEAHVPGVHKEHGVSPVQDIGLQVLFA